MRYNVKENGVLIGIFATKENAHMFAECYSYSKHQNAIYGLFKIEITENW